MPYRDVHADDGAHAQTLHDIGGKEVEQAPIDQQVSIERDRRVVSWQASRRHQPLVQRSVFMHEALGASEVRRYAEVLDPEVFNLGVGSEHLQNRGGVPATEKGYERRRVVPQRLDTHLDESSPAELDHRARIVSQRVQGGDDAADAGAANDVDGDCELFQGPDDTDVGQAAGTASAQDEAERAPRQAPGESAHVSIRSVADVVMGGDAPLRQPRPGARRPRRAARVHQDQLGGGARRPRVQRIGFEAAQNGRRVSTAHEQNAICLTDASGGPW